MSVESTADRIQWLGHDAIRINGGPVVYIDPYQLSDGPRADLILITHEHYDHCSPGDVKKIQGPDTVIVTEKDSARKLSGKVTVVAPGDTVTAAGVIVQAVPAYNLDKKYHPKKKGWLGFILEIQGVRIYHAGDTDFIPEMEGFRADIALLPVSGTYVMTAREAVQAALAIGPSLALPIHYGTLVGSAEDAEVFRKGLEGKVPVRVLDKA
jgi:L-ascorbate metabolism protein UlaG (beta-lactamase superfamily)